MNARTVIEKAKQHEALDEEIRSYLLPRMCRLYSEKKLNGGKLPPNKSITVALSIVSYSFCEEGLAEDKDTGETLILAGTITVQYEIHWGGDNYDYDSITLTEKEWENTETWTKYTP